MPTRSPRLSPRRATAFALFTTLVAGVTSIGPSSVAGPEDEGGARESDAVIFRPTAQDLRRPVVDQAPADARRTDATNRRADAGNVIDVAFVYPASLVTQADIGGIVGLRAKFNKGIADANTAFKNSGVPVQLRNVGDRQVAAATSTDIFAMYKNLGTAGDGVYDEAQALREETHADLVSLWASGSVPLGDSCGIGGLGGSSGERDPEYSGWTTMFYTDCEDRFLVFAHEVGHNFSGDHDATAKSPPSGGKPYARGYTDPAHQFVTVMSYYEACATVGVQCTRIPYYSSPTIKTPEGYPTGTAATDNARAIAEQAPVVANYRQSQIYPAAPSISGKANRGKQLIANAPGWAPGNVTFTYQWIADGVPIAGATGPKLTVVKSLVGTSISVTVTGAAPFYAPVAATSASTAPIAKKLFKKTSRPRIKGAARPGRAVRAVVKAWKPGKKVKYRYTWYRNGNKIKGAKKAVYRVKGKDRGKKLSVKVTGKRRGFETTSRFSRKVKVRR